MDSRSINKVLEPLRRRLRVMITRSIVKLVDSSTLMQELQLEALADELLDGIEHFEQYGYTCNPQPGAEALLANIGGSRSKAVAICVADRRFRLKNMASGEVALYTDEGDVIHFKRGNHIYIDSAAKVTVKAPNVDITASTKVTMTTPLLEVTGDINAGGDVVGNGISLDNHVHGGVSPGGSNTGGPV